MMEVEWPGDKLSDGSGMAMQGTNSVHSKHFAKDLIKNNYLRSPSCICG